MLMEKHVSTHNTVALWNFDHTIFGQTSINPSDPHLVPTERSLNTFEKSKDHILPQQLTENSKEVLGGFSWRNLKDVSQFAVPYTPSINQDLMLEMWFRPNDEKESLRYVYRWYPNRITL